MVTNWTGPPAMLATFKKMFGSFSCPHIIKQNNFSNLQHYYLQKVHRSKNNNIQLHIYFKLFVFRQFQSQWLV